MAEYLELAQLAEDEGFRLRVKVALLEQARIVVQQNVGDTVPASGPGSRVLTQPRADKRKALADLVLHHPDDHVERWSWAIVPAFKTEPTATNQAITDTKIDTQIGDLAWDIMAGVVQAIDG